MEERLVAAGGELLAERRGSVATVTLNRPQLLNALSFEMIRGLATWLEAWERDDRVRTIVLRGAGDKAFSSGGDVRAIAASLGKGESVQEFFEVEYALDYRIHTYPKTIVAVIDGIVMGGGMGLAQGAALRIVGPRTRMAMPETAIGLFPDVGGSYFLSRVPGKLGIYLGLVGPTLRAADAIYCGLADTYVGHEPLPQPTLEALRPAIDRHFAHESVPAILASLESEADPRWRDWAHATRAMLGRHSPTMLAVTLEQLKRGAHLSLADCFRMELNLVQAALEHGDFLEGVRALLVEKDRKPRWRPGLAPDSLQKFFTPRWTPAQHPLASLQ